jgi:hypothetical protein
MAAAAPPQLGADTDSVLAELGYAAAETAALRAAPVVCPAAAQRSVIIGERSERGSPKKIVDNAADRVEILRRRKSRLVRASIFSTWGTFLSWRSRRPSGSSE